MYSASRTLQHMAKRGDAPRFFAKLSANGCLLYTSSVYLYGRPDYERPGRGITERKTPKQITKGIDKSKPILVLEHEPRQLQELADAGVDAQLCGHTHDGQMFPGNLLTGLMWENSYGYMKKAGMHSIVTSGAVSYTHLDVYKRQGHRSCSGRSCKGLSDDHHHAGLCQ